MYGSNLGDLGLNRRNVALLALGVLSLSLVARFTQVPYLSYSLVLGVAKGRVSQDTFDWLCDLGNSTLQHVQPMVSDEEMIAHLSTHRELFDQIAETASKGEDVRQGGGLKSEFRDALLRAELTWATTAGAWPLAIESGPSPSPLACDRPSESCVRPKRVVVLTPGFGKSTGAFFCTTRQVSFKTYKYFPQPAPTITGDRLIVGRSADGTSAFSSELVVGEALQIQRRACLLRQIDANWFISLC